jgi:hypothetical protein
MVKIGKQRKIDSLKLAIYLLPIDRFYPIDSNYKLPAIG